MKLIKKILSVAVAMLSCAICAVGLSSVTVKAEQTVDITQNVSASGWISQSELRVTYLNVGTGVIPGGVGYGIIDKDNYTYVQDYVAINGKTIKEINTDTSLNAASWTYTVFPSTADAKYKLPIIVYVNNGAMEIKLHSEYVALLGDSVEITAKAGLYFVNGATRYEVTEDKTFTVWSAPVIDKVDISEKISLEGWDVTGNEGELTYTRLCFEQGILPTDLNYSILDKSAWMYVQDYLLVNGKSVKSINAETDTSSYNFATFPSTAAAIYKIPVIIFANGNTLELKVHNDYVSTMSSPIEITVKKGLHFETNGVWYEVMEDRTFTVQEKEPLPEEDIADKINLVGWDATGDQSELTYARLVFEQGILPNGIDYDVLDKGTWMYLQEYVLINGKSVKQINEETDTSAYVFHTFPSTADAKYQIPIIVFVKNGIMELKFHNDYVKTLGESIEITVKAGLYIASEEKIFVVGKDVEYILTGKIWSDKNKVYAITYYLNGEVYGEVEYLPYNAAITLRNAPETALGYSFGGWEYNGATTVLENLQIYGYTQAVRYAVTYHLNGGVNHSCNPIVYYVTDGEIALQDASKDGATFKGWYTSSDYTQKVETLSPELLGDMQLYALFEENKSESGCNSVAGWSSGLFALSGVVLVLVKRKRKE